MSCRFLVTQGLWSEVLNIERCSICISPYIFVIILRVRDQNNICQFVPFHYANSVFYYPYVQCRQMLINNVHPLRTVYYDM